MVRWSLVKWNLFFPLFSNVHSFFFFSPVELYFFSPVEGYLFDKVERDFLSIQKMLALKNLLFFTHLDLRSFISCLYQVWLHNSEQIWANPLRVPPIRDCSNREGIEAQYKQAKRLLRTNERQDSQRENLSHSQWGNRIWPQRKNWVSRIRYSSCLYNTETSFHNAYIAMTS